MPLKRMGSSFSASLCGGLVHRASAKRTRGVGWRTCLTSRRRFYYHAPAVARSWQIHNDAGLGAWHRREATAGRLEQTAWPHFLKGDTSMPKVEYTCKICGNLFLAYASSRRSGACSQECGRQLIGASIRRHGESGSRLHSIWSHMKTRCLCSTSQAYEYYGGRGITVCQEWQDSYESFRDWALANGYSDGLELDRREANGGYEPGNCRWATRTQQMRNTRKRRDGRTSKFKGVSKHSQNRGRWIAQAHENKRSLNLGSFGTELEAALAYDDYVFARDPEHSYLNFQERKRRKEVSIVSA